MSVWCMWLCEWPGNHCVPTIPDDNDPYTLLHNFKRMKCNAFHSIPNFADLNFIKHIWEFLYRRLPSLFYLLNVSGYLVSWRIKLDHATHNSWLVCQHSMKALCCFEGKSQACYIRDTWYLIYCYHYFVHLMYTTLCALSFTVFSTHTLFNCIASSR